MKVGIIGGGMMGLATAFYLAKEGIHVTVLEKESEIGGLSRSQEIMPGLTWDCYYHVILPTDSELIEIIRDIGLYGDLMFRETKTGFYTDGQLHSLSSTWEFLRFNPLTFWHKLRLGAGVFYASKIDDWKRLESIDAKTWLVEIFGAKNYEKMWEPLLRSKLGTAKDRASASFIWACIKRYYGTRYNSSKRELMGCVRGGYNTILSRLKEKLSENGVTILLRQSVEKLEPNGNGSIRIWCNGDNSFDYDRVVVTVPNPLITNLWPDMPDDFRPRLEKIRYLSLICVTIVLKRSLLPFYVTNLTDSGFPFTGIIEATNAIPLEDVGAKHIVYLPRYMAPDDTLSDHSDQEILDIFLEALRRICPDLSDQDIIAQAVNREPYVQPIQELNYSQHIPPMRTPIENLYLVNTTMILNSTLNNNEVIKLAREMVQMVAND